MTIAQILTVLDEAHKEAKNGHASIKEQEGRCAEEELQVIRSGACSVQRLCSETNLSLAQITQLMQDAKAEELLVHRVVNGVKYVRRRHHVAMGESGWSPSFEG